VLCYQEDDDQPPPRPLPPQECLVEDTMVYIVIMYVGIKIIPLCVVSSDCKY